MSDSNLAIRNKLYDFIRVVDDKKLHAIYNLLQNDIDKTQEWWKDKAFTSELDHRYQSLENGTDKGIPLMSWRPQQANYAKKGMANVPAHVTILSSLAQKKLHKHGIGKKKGNQAWVFDL